MPIFVMGFTFIASSFILFDYLHTRIINLKNDGSITNAQATIYETLNGTLNGLIVVILNAVYGYIIMKLVKWENHK